MIGVTGRSRNQTRNEKRNEKRNENLQITIHKGHRIHTIISNHTSLLALTKQHEPAEAKRRQKCTSIILNYTSFNHFLLTL